MSMPHLSLQLLDFPFVPTQSSKRRRICAEQTHRSRRLAVLSSRLGSSTCDACFCRQLYHNVFLYCLVPTVVVVQSKSFTKVDEAACAYSLGPALLPSEGTDMKQMADAMKAANEVVRCMIVHADAIFAVTPVLASTSCVQTPHCRMVVMLVPLEALRPSRIGRPLHPSRCVLHVSV